MDSTKVFKRQGMFIACGIVCVLSLFIGVSYSLFTKKLQSNSNMVVQAGNLVTNFSGSDVISGELLPMADSDALTSTDNVYTFNIENTGTLDTDYKVILYTDTSVEGNPVPHEFVHFTYDNSVVQTLSEVTTSNTTEVETEKEYIIGSGIMDAGSTSQNHTIRVWISRDIPVDNIGDVVAFKIKVVSEIKK